MMLHKKRESSRAAVSGRCAARRPTTGTLGVGLCLVAALGIAGCGDDDGAAAVRLASIDVAEVLHEERLFVDTTRPTRANGGAPGSPDRRLMTRVWYAPTALAAPACDGERCALVVLAHGYGGSTARFDAIARLLAAAGYVVAAPSFPLTNEAAPGGHLPGMSDLRQQPADLAVVIDAMLDAASDDTDPLYGRIDSERIGALGHSLGGATVSGATRSTCCVDTRLDATVLVAPAFVVQPLLLGGPATAAGPPALVINGSDDPLITPTLSLETARTFAPPWYFVEIPGVGHSPLIENIGEPEPALYVTARAARAFFDEYLGGAVGATAPALAQLEAEGQGVELSE